MQTQREKNYKLTGVELEQACKLLHGEPQKILIVNNPNNPTGSVYRKEEVKEIADVARRHNVIVISDEIYSNLCYASSPYHSFMREYPEGTIVTSGLSKGHSAGGYRLGFLAAASNMASVVTCLASLTSETFSAVSSPTQYAALAAFSDDPEIEGYVSQCCKIHQAAGDYLYEAFVAMNLNCSRPEGAFYLFPDFENFKDALFKKGILNAGMLCDHLLDAIGVATLPANDFYYPPEFLGCRVASVDYDGAELYRRSLEVEVLDAAFIETYCPKLKKGVERLKGFTEELEQT